MVPWNKGLTKATNEKVATIGRKNSDRMKGKPGRKLSASEKQKIGDRFKGVKKTDEHKLSLSRSLRGKPNLKLPHRNPNREEQAQKVRMRKICSRILHRCLSRGFQKTDSTEHMLGYTRQQLKEHLESQFSGGMSWSNYGRGIGKWNIDHIRPICMFDICDPAKVNALENLRPLWAEENLRRPKDGSDEIVDPQHRREA